MEDNQNTNTSEQVYQNPYPNFEPEQQKQEQFPPQYAYNNDLNQPLVIDDQQPNNNDLSNKFLEVVKYANLLAGLYVSIVGLYFIFTLKIWPKHGNFLMSFYSMFLPIFYIFFGVLLILGEAYKLETNIYFRFIRTYLGRGIFNIFLATQCNFAWASPGDFFAWILNLLGLIYIFLHFIRARIQPEVKQNLMG